MVEVFHCTVTGNTMILKSRPGYSELTRSSGNRGGTVLTSREASEYPLPS